MNYHNITKDDMLNGDGLRVVLWVSGCSHHCEGCQNPVTWDPEGGLPFKDAEKTEIFRELEKPYVEGITFSGGDPLHPSNRQAVAALIREIRNRFPEKNIWLYTGYTWEEIRHLEMISDVDILVDGRFILKDRDVNLHWKGSPNQRVIDVKETIKTGTVILHA